MSMEKIRSPNKTRPDQRSWVAIVTGVPSQVTRLTHQHLCWAADPQTTSPLGILSGSPSGSNKLA
ncbi:hypothetical protein TIFTF001_027363 [Ficus carica]|uniref:Uncharacterized protein n=1 Tax=Ficus carica TaxID=3494 RepID=A0AA88DMW3_FICCA|nr:hypothetical protein TIFTF001_027363 [Ficus carica]